LHALSPKDNYCAIIRIAFFEAPSLDWAFCVEEEQLEVIPRNWEVIFPGNMANILQANEQYVVRLKKTGRLDPLALGAV